jgi:hypothetical protein
VGGAGPRSGTHELDEELAEAREVAGDQRNGLGVLLGDEVDPVPVVADVEGVALEVAEAQQLGQQRLRLVAENRYSYGRTASAIL